MLEDSAASAAAHFDGSGASLAWSIPFAGLLLSIALLPLVAHKFWEHHFGKVAAFWSFALIIPVARDQRDSGRRQRKSCTPFFSTTCLSSSCCSRCSSWRAASASAEISSARLPPTRQCSPSARLSASFLGTTGASMVLIRPMIRANQGRRYHIHVFVFFIFLVSNIGGSLTPLGDPPLFLGFLKGVDFLWTLEAMLLPMLFMSGILLALFYLIDRIAWNREHAELRGRSRVPRQLRIDGLHNVPI